MKNHATIFNLPTTKRMLVHLLFLFVLLFQLSAKDIFVSPSGNNTTGTGTIGRPYLSIQKAAMVAVAGDVVQVRAGTYREQITPTNSGSAGSAITYQPYNNEVVVISGANVITGWSAHSGSIYKAAMSGGFMNTDYNQTDQIFVDKKMVTLARWPNCTSQDPSYPTQSTITTFESKTTAIPHVVKFRDSKLPSPVVPADKFDGAEIYVQPNNMGWSWTLSGSVTSVAAVSLNQIVMTTNNDTGADGNNAIYAFGSRYYMFNKMSLLDAAGEWYHDKTAQLLYLWCPDNTNPSTHVVEGKAREYAFDLTGKSYITIKGFNLFACSITTDLLLGGGNLASSVGSYKRHPYLSTSTNIIIDGINAKYLSHFTNVEGSFLYQWGQSSGIVLSGMNHLIQNSVIQYSAGNGVALAGSGHKVLNNYISNVNYMSIECSAVNSTGTCVSEGFEIANNSITKCGRSGITPRPRYVTTPTQAIRIHHNDIYDCMLQDWDGGGIYAIGDYQFMRVDHNTVHDIPGYLNCGIYFDWSKSMVIDHNVVWNTEQPIKLQHNDASLGYTNAVIYNNTLVSKLTAGNTSASYCNIGGTGDKKGSFIQNNICVYRNGAITTPPTTPSFKNYESGYFVAGSAVFTTNLENGDPKFVDFANGNLQLQEGSAAIDEGTTMAEVTTGGSTVPAYNDAATGVMDIGAYEFGQPAFTTGASAAVLNRVGVIDLPTAANQVQANELGMKMYPNPIVDGKLKVDFNDPATEKVSVSIFDLMGKVVYSTQLSNELSTSIDVSSLKGLYIVRATNGAQAFSGKIVVK